VYQKYLVSKNFNLIKKEFTGITDENWYFSDTLEKKGTGIGYYTEHLLKYISDVAKENDTIYTIDWKKERIIRTILKYQILFPSLRNTFGTLIV